MYNAPSWSSSTLSELLEKANDFTKQAYSSSFSALAFFERASGTSSEHADAKVEISELLKKHKK